jgi:hypothetical protein
MNGFKLKADGDTQCSIDNYAYTSAGDIRATQGGSRGTLAFRLLNPGTKMGKKCGDSVTLPLGLSMLSGRIASRCVSPIWRIAAMQFTVPPKRLVASKARFSASYALRMELLPITTARSLDIARFCLIASYCGIVLPMVLMFSLGVRYQI